MADVSIAELLLAAGFVGDAAHRARAVLEDAGLTRASKVRMAATKVVRARQVLHEQLARSCGAAECEGAANGREVVRVPREWCEVCGGSRNRRAGQAARQAMLATGTRRVLVLGGTPATLRGLQECLQGGAVEVRGIDGTAGVRPTATVEADLAWADVLVVWASTPLPHKVSVPYTTRARGRLPTITVPRRGVEAVCQELLRWLERHQRPCGK